jgi:hypothetical protein
MALPVSLAGRAYAMIPWPVAVLLPAHLWLVIAAQVSLALRSG